MKGEFDKFVAQCYSKLQPKEVDVIVEEETEDEESTVKYDYVFRLTSDPNNGNLQCFKMCLTEGGYYLKNITNLFELTPTQILQLQNSLINNAVAELVNYKNYSFICTSSSVNPSDFAGYLDDLSDEDLININRKVSIPVDYNNALKEMNRITSAEGK